MRHLCLIVLIGMLLLATSGCQVGPGRAFAASTEAEGLGEVANLRRDIQLLNLINGLDLSAEKMQFILDRASEAKAIREEIRSRAQGNTAATSQVLSELRETLMRGEVISSELRDEFLSVEGELRKDGASLNVVAREIRAIRGDETSPAAPGALAGALPEVMDYWGGDPRTGGGDAASPRGPAPAPDRPPGWPGWSGATGASSTGLSTGSSSSSGSRPCCSPGPAGPWARAGCAPS